MSLVRPLAFDRAERVGISRISTLRDTDHAPTDVVIKNLSRTGCLFQYDAGIPLGTSISLGIAGVGVRAGQVVRVEDAEHGCEFLVPLSDADVSTALAGNTVVRGSFEWSGSSSAQLATAQLQPVHDTVAEDEMRLSIRRKIAIIVGANVLLWGLVIGLVAIIRSVS